MAAAAADGAAAPRSAGKQPILKAGPPGAGLFHWSRQANDLLPASDSTVMQIRALEKLAGGAKP